MPFVFWLPLTTLRVAQTTANIWRHVFHGLITEISDGQVHQYLFEKVRFLLLSERQQKSWQQEFDLEWEVLPSALA